MYDARNPDFVKSRAARIAMTEEIAPTLSPLVPTPIATAFATASAGPLSPVSRNAESERRWVQANLVAQAALFSAASPPLADVPIKAQSEGFMSPAPADSAPHFAQVMPNTVVALGVESKREILRAQLAQLQGVWRRLRFLPLLHGSHSKHCPETIEVEKLALHELISLVRFYGPGPAATAAKEQLDKQRRTLAGLLGARKQVFVAMEKIGTTPSVFSTLPVSSRFSTLHGSRLELKASAGAPDGEGAAAGAAAAPATVSAPAVLAAAVAAVPPEPAVVKAKASYSYNAASAKELSFKKGEILIIRDEDDSGWWYAENAEKKLGFVPANYVKKMESPLPL